MKTQMRTRMRALIGDRDFYRMVLIVAIPIMIQNGITNFVSMLDNIMVGRIRSQKRCCDRYCHCQSADFCF